MQVETRLRQHLSRLLGALAFVIAVAAVPLTAALQGGPATSVAQCPAGQTGVIYGCSPFCLPGKFLDTSTGLCTPVAPPAPPAPTPRY